MARKPITLDEFLDLRRKVRPALGNILSMFISLIFMSYLLRDYYISSYTPSDKSNLYHFIYFIYQKELKVCQGETLRVDLLIFITTTLHFIRLFMCLNFLDRDETLSKALDLYYQRLGDRTRCKHHKIEYLIRILLLVSVVVFIFLFTRINDVLFSIILISQAFLMMSFYYIYAIPMFCLDKERVLNYTIFISDLLFCSFAVFIAIVTFNNVSYNLIVYGFMFISFAFYITFIMELCFQFNSFIFSSIILIRDYFLAKVQ